MNFCKTLRCAASLFLVLFCAATGHAQILVNGSFESNYSGWLASGNQNIAVAGVPYTATNGTKLVAFNSGNTTPNGVLSQTFSTVAQQTYTLAFELGAFAGDSTPQRMSVIVAGRGTGSLLSQTVTINGPNGAVTR